MTQKQHNDRTAIFTICSNNYIPFARILLDSCRAHHPKAALFLCLADAKLAADAYDPEWGVVSAEELAIPDMAAFAFRYDVMEFNTALKPYMVLYLFEKLGFERVLYFDPDIELHRPLDTVMDPLEAGASFVLTPHLCAPAETDQSPDDMTIMRAGIYNLGFLGVSQSTETRDVIRWWARRLRFHCISAQHIGIFVDQKFMDLVPGFVSHVHIARDTSLNVAYWNLLQRTLEMNGDSYQVDGKPLGFYHFSGFNPYLPNRLSKHTDLFTGTMPATLARLTADYRERLLRNGYGTYPAGEYAYGRFTSGTIVHPLVRQMFRERHSDWPSDPFSTYEDFLHLPAPNAAQASTHIVTEFMVFLHSISPHLSTRLNLAHPADAKELVEWFVRRAEHDLALDPRLVEPSAARLGAGRAAKAALVTEPGRTEVTVVGYLRAASGVGEAGRQTLAALTESGLGAEGLDVALNVMSERNDESVAHHITEQGTGRILIYHINADQLPLVQEHVRDQLRPGAIRVSVPFWELSAWPEAWRSAFDNVDEIWAPSRFVQTTLSRAIDKPVIHMPVALHLPPPVKVDRASFDLPEDRFLFFYAFDFLSFMQRKNPAAALAAFRQAFPKRGTAGLVIKTMNGVHAPKQLAAFRKQMADDPDVILIDGTLPRNRSLALIAACNCVLSLHRSEGLGLLIAEAMLLERPVIATDYSASTEFVTPRTGYPVDYQLVPVGENDYPHAAGQVWADADVSHAAWLMRRLAADPASSHARIGQAQQFVQNVHSRPRVAARLLERLRLLGGV
jgi:glycosyltransferase involved in cell wall biosynthesis